MNQENPGWVNVIISELKKREKPQEETSPSDKTNGQDNCT